MTFLKDMRDLMNQAFEFAVETVRKPIASKIIEFTVESHFNILLREEIMQLLIKGRMYGLITELVKANAMLHLDVT